MYDKATYLRELSRCARRIGVPAYWLDAVIYSESRRNPQAVNKDSDAVGLIQFMPFTLAGLGLTRNQVMTATVAQHFEYVARYFEAQYKAFGIVPRRDLTDPAKLYNVVFYPKAVKDGLFLRRGSPAYDLNSGLDHNGDGAITDGDMRVHITPKLKEAEAYVGAPAGSATDGIGWVWIAGGLTAAAVIIATSRKPAPSPTLSSKEAKELIAALNGLKLAA